MGPCTERFRGIRCFDGLKGISFHPYVDTRKGTIRTAVTRSSHLYSEPERPQAPGSISRSQALRFSFAVGQRGSRLRSFISRSQTLHFTFTVGHNLQAPELHLDCRMSGFPSSVCPCKMRDKKLVAPSTLPRASLPVGARQKSVLHLLSGTPRPPGFTSFKAPKGSRLHFL